MLEVAMRASYDDTESQDLEQEKQAAIAVLKQQLANLLDLYKNAIITAEEYYRDKADRERQISFWEARTSDMQKKAIEFERVMVGFSQLLDLWQSADSDSRSGLARGLFQYIVVDLDTQQIVDYRLHPWADQYLIARADLYGGDDDTDFGSIDDVSDADENGELDDSDVDFEGNKNRFTDALSDEAVHDPNGTRRHRILAIPKRSLAA